MRASIKLVQGQQGGLQATLFRTWGPLLGLTFFCLVLVAQSAALSACLACTPLRPDIDCVLTPAGGGNEIDCEPVTLVGGTKCCDCGEGGIPAGAPETWVPCPDPPEPPDPPVTPQPPCVDGGGPCDEFSISGQRDLCKNALTRAVQMTVRSDGTTSTSDGDGGNCPDEPTCNTGSCVTPPTTPPTCHPSMGIYRRIVPSHQTEYFSLGRGMAADFDLRMTIYPGTSAGHIGLLFDPVLAQLLYFVDEDEDGVYELQLTDDAATPTSVNFTSLYYKSVRLVHATTGALIPNPADAALQPVVLKIERNNGYKYELEVNPTPMVYPTPTTPGELSTRLKKKTTPQGKSITYTYQTFTPAEIVADPERQLRLASMSDDFGNNAAFTYKATKLGGRWVLESVNFNSGEQIVEYDYTANGLLSVVERNNEVASSYSYGVNSQTNLATLAISERVGSVNETLELSPDYMTNPNQTVVNQLANILQVRKNGLGQVVSAIYHDNSNPGWYKVLHEGTMSEINMGKTVRYYTSYTQSGPGYSGITGTLESTYSQNPNITTEQWLKGQPPQTTDETGYTVTNTYDAKGNLSRVDHPNGTFEKWIYDANLRKLLYYRDRAGYVTTTEYDANWNPVRVVRGMKDISGSGTPTAEPEAVQDLMGYYPTGHANAGLLAWQGTAPYSGTTFTAPAANDRTDFVYDPKGRLIKVIKPLPEGQSTRPETESTWVGNLKATDITELDHTITYSYDPLGRKTQTLYSDGTTSETYYDDVNKQVATKDRMGLVDLKVYGPSDRLIYHYPAFSTTTSILSGSFGSAFPEDQRKTVTYAYYSGTKRPSEIRRENASTDYVYDYRGRSFQENKYPNLIAGTMGSPVLRTEHVYVNNMRFYSRDLTTNGATREVRTYYGYSANRLTVRTIQTRKPGVTFADNTAVINAVRAAATAADPDFIINDAVRNVRGEIVQLIDPLGIESLTTYDALGRSLIQKRKKGSLELLSQSSYDHNGNVTQTTSETGLLTSMLYDPAGNLKTRTVGVGVAAPLVPMVWNYTYGPDSRQLTETAPGGAVTTSVVQTCCGFTTGTKNALGHGQVTNRDSNGRTVHSATLEDFVSHTNLLNPVDSKTLSETTSKYALNGDLQFRTLWKSALGAIDRNNPPIAGVGGVPVANGLTTQYVRLLTNTPTRTINRLGSGTAQVSISAALTQLALPVNQGGAGVAFYPTTLTGVANLVIAPDEKTMQVSIADCLGRSVMNATMSGPAATTPNQLLNWSCTRYDDIDTTTNSIATIKTSQIDPAGKTVSSFADGFGRTIATVDQLNKKSTHQYDSGGNLLWSINALNQDTIYTYDSLARQLTVTDPMNHVQKSYDPTTGLVNSLTDNKGQVTSFGYDGFGRRKNMTDRLGKVTSIAYDSAGRLLSITDAQSKMTVYGYNIVGQRILTTLPDNTSRTFEYDPAGRIKKLTLESDISQTTVYEFSGVVDKIEYRNAAGILLGTDDYSYNSLLRQTGATSRYNANSAWTYDDEGRILTESLTYSGQTYQVGYHYDNRGRLDEITYPSGRKASYTFDQRNSLDKIKWQNVEIEDRGYDDLGRLNAVVRAGSAVDETRGYDNAGRLTSVNNTNVGNAAYTYDANHNKLSEAWTGAMAAWNFVTTNTGANPQGYDAEDRFVHFAQAAQSKTFNFTRSDIGNINNINLNGSGTARGFSNIHALTSIGSASQTFDNDGNLTTSWSGHTNTWDEAGVMKQSVVPTNSAAGIAGTNEYGYDADRKRVWKKITRQVAQNPPSVVEHSVYVHAGPNLIAQYPAGTPAASPTQEYVYAQEIDSLIMLVRNNGNDKLTITRNQQWSVTALSDSANGNVLERYTYDHFGKRTILEPNGTSVRATSSYNMPFGYTSREHDAETGLMYFRARFYDPHTAEFTSPDPLEYVDGMSSYRAFFIPGGIDPSGLQIWAIPRVVPVPRVYPRIYTPPSTPSIPLKPFTPPVPVPPPIYAPPDGPTVGPSGSSNPGSTPGASPVPEPVWDPTAHDLDPPGRCTQERHRQLANEVYEHCKKPPAPKACGFLGWSCQDYSDYEEKWEKCAKARNAVAVECFGGGNRTHRDEIEKAWDGAEGCRKLFYHWCLDCDLEDLLTPRGGGGA